MRTWRYRVAVANPPLDLTFDLFDIILKGKIMKIVMGVDSLEVEKKATRLLEQSSPDNILTANVF